MKKLFSILILICLITSVHAQKIVKAGNWKGNAYTFGSDKTSEIVSNAINAYNNLDLDLYLSYFTDDYVNNNKERLKKLFNSYKTVKKDVWAIIPVRNIKNETYVLTYSDVTREWKNKSKSKHSQHDIYFVNDTTKKITGFWSTLAPDDSNDFGLPTGGKIYLKSGNTTFQFTNRGEIAAIEKMQIALNKMDVEGLSAVFTDSITWKGSNGVIEKAPTKAFWTKSFSNLQSMNWKVQYVLPWKITDTDPVSGILVAASYDQVLKDGTKLSKNQNMIFTYELDGKISTVDNYIKDVKPAVSAVNKSKEVVTKFWNALSTGDLETLKKTMSKDFSFSLNVKNPEKYKFPDGTVLKAEYKGQDEFFGEFLGKALGMMKTPLKFNLDDMMVNEKSASIVWHGETTTKYGDYNNKYIYYLKIDANGLISSMTEYTDTYYAETNLFGLKIK